MENKRNADPKDSPQSHFKTESEKQPQKTIYLKGILYLFCLETNLLVSMLMYASAHGVYYFDIFTHPELTFEADFIGGSRNAFSLSFEVVVWSFWGVTCRTAYQSLHRMLDGSFEFLKYFVIWAGTILYAWGIAVTIILSLSIISLKIGNTDITLSNASFETIAAISFIIGFYNEKSLKILEHIQNKISSGIRSEKKEAD